MSVALRSKKLADGRKSLYLDIYHNGKRYYEFINLYLVKGSNKDTLKLAESIRAKRQIELQNSEHGFIPHFKRKINFVEYFKKLTKKKNEIAWRNTKNYLERFTEGHIKIGAIDEEWLEQFKSYLLTNVSNNTAHLYFSKIQAALNQAVKDKIIQQKPLVSNVKMQETKREYLTIDELQRMASTPCKSKEVKRAFLFSCYTGLRYSDIKALTWHQIKNNRIDYRQQKTKVFEYLDLSPMAMRILNDKPNIVSIQGHVFNLPSRAYVAIVMKEWAELAGIEKNITFHSGRHTFATLALTQGADLYTVSKILGHKDISTTQIYAKIVDEKKRAAVNSLPEVQITNN